MKRIAMHFRCIKLHLQAHPLTVLRLVIAGICGVVAYAMAATFFVNPEVAPLSVEPKYPRDGFIFLVSISILFSIFFWHLLLWPVLFSRNLFIFLKPKPCLFAIDYIWYFGAFIAFAAVANLAFAQYLKSEREISFFDAQNINTHATNALAEKNNNCQTIVGYLEARPRLRFETEGFNEVQLICDSEISGESSDVDIMNLCQVSSTSYDNRMLYPTGVDHAAVPKLYGLALEGVSSICYYSRLDWVSNQNADKFLYSSESLDRDLDGPDLRIFFLPILLIGLRLVKTTSEILSNNREGVEVFTNRIIPSFNKIMPNFKRIIHDFNKIIPNFKRMNRFKKT